MQQPIDLVRTKILADGGVTALVAQRVYLMAQAQNAAYPNIVISPVSAMNTRELDASYGQKGFRISVECRSAQVAQANALGALVFIALDGFQGAISGTPVDRILHVGEAFLWEDVSLTARRILDFHVHL